MQNLNTKVSYSLLFIILFFYISPASAAKIMGYIGSYKGLASDFKLIRDGKREPVKHNKPLYVGDKIRVIRKNSSIKLKVSNKNINLYRNSLTYQVKDTSDRATIIKNMVSVFSDWWGSLWEASDEEKRIAATRGNYPPTIPLLKTNQTKLKAGKNRVYLAWRGGKAPYTVTIQRKNIETQKNWMDIQKLSFKTAKDRASFSKQQLQLEIGGIYWMIIEDKNGEKASKEFTVIDNLPAFKLNYQEKHQIKTSKNQLFACAAMFRRKQNQHSQWNFEISQIIAGGGDKEILSTCGIN
ncbi:hypothetical protein [Candidatus Marithrix sp. Canyon 246]|uniref:hypothetical protein n=1 Tax=Candidatus Marithrix sp. Canyon 246 TaxID=1827136 RepID=UPI00114D3BC7|nr:hypothetical protein [Candidatus Marithrix sp. Canyon 246]